ncbi:MAG: hypothetical protein AAGF84_03095 [Planctomycetota bacterium]
MSLRPPAGLCLAALAAGLMLPLAPRAHPQTSATPPTTPEPPAAPEAPALAPATQALDLERLLTDNLVQGSNLGDPVWQLDDVDGRSPMLIPIRLTPGQASTELANPDVSLGGARFVGWWVPEAVDAPDAATSRRSSARRGGRGSDEFNQEPRFIAGDSRFAHMLGDPNADPTGGALSEPTLEVVEPTEPGPRLARSITVQPDGRLTWEMDRSFQGASLQSGDNLYVLKLDPVRLREQQPEPAARPSRNTNETAAEYNLRRRQVQQEFRQEQQAFRELRESVQSLPDTFGIALEQLPGQVVWAVFLTQDRRTALAFEGDAEGLPWSVDVGTFEVLRGGSSGTSATAADPIATMDGLASRGDPLSMRAVAISMTRGTGNGFREMTVGDPTARLAQKLVLGSDAVAARTVIEALAEVDPPTDATRRLLDIAAQTDDPLAKLAALRASLRSSADNPAAVARILQQAVAVLQDPAGPPPEEVLAALAGTNDNPSSNRRSGGAPTNAIPALALGVPFESISDDQRAGAVRWVLQHADDPQSLPAAWLDTKLLGSGHEPLLRETLEQLAAAEVVYPENTAAPVLEPPSASATRAFREFVFGGSTNTPETSAEVTTPATPPLRIAPLPITSPQHGLFTALQHPDAALQAQAWSVLPKFTITSSNSRTDAGPVLEAIVAAAPTPTPKTLVPFLGKALQDSGSSQAATAALMQLAATGDPNASAQAVDALLTPTTDRNGQPRRLSLSQAWRNLEPADQVGFTAAIYTAQFGSDTPVAGLAANDRAGSWFVRELEQGQVPEPGDWLEPLGGETQAIDVAGSEDDAIAHGALAALAAAVGADADAQREVISRLGAAPRSADELQVAWPGVQRELIVAQLAEAAGEYQLVLQVTQGRPDAPAADPDMGRGMDPGMGMSTGMGMDGFDPATAVANPGVDATDGQDGPAAIVPTTVVLGVVELTVDDTTVALVGDPITLDVPDTFAALRIADPLQLRNFPTPDVANLPLEEAAAPIDLRRAVNGDWVGRTAFGEAHTLEVRMEPSR